MSIKSGKNVISKCLLIAILLIVAPLFARAQSFGTSPFSRGFGMKGIHTYAGFGFADYEVKSPVNQLRMNKGIFAFLGGEREVNDDGTSITIAFNYMSTDGEALYNYSNLAGSQYQGSFNFDSTNYQLSVGVKQRFFPESWFRPYVEGGGIFGYYEFEYSDPLDSVVIVGPGDRNAWKRKEGLTGFGFYGEAGLEVDFSESFGTKIGGRYQNITTRNFETLANQKVKFENFVFLMSFLIRL